MSLDVMCQLVYMFSLLIHCVPNQILLYYVVCEKEYKYEKSNVKFPDVLLLPARFGNAHSLDTAVS